MIIGFQAHDVHRHTISRRVAVRCCPVAICKVGPSQLESLPGLAAQEIQMSIRKLKGTIHRT